MNRHTVKQFLLAAMLLVCAPAGAGTIVLTPNDTIDFDGNSTDDLIALNAGSLTSIREQNGTLLAKLVDQAFGTTWEDTTLTLVQGLDYAEGAPGGEVPQSVPGFLDDIFVYKTPNNNFYKLRDAGPNDASGITLEWELVGSGTPPPPVANFSATSFDIVAEFTDTSTGTPSSWAWDFDDGNSSTNQNPTHVFADEGTFNVCLIASNVGGDSPQVCQDITITEEPSTVVARGASLDLDNDSLDDLLVEEDAGCGVNSPNRFTPQNGAQAGAVLEDYRTVDLTDAQGASLSPQQFCHPDADFETTMIVSSSNGFFYKLWTPENDSTGVRFVFELLGTPPPPPTASFTFESFDIVSSFTDESTGVVTSWSWDFGDGDSSTNPNPIHAYAGTGTFSVCLIVSNAGGDSPQVCQDVSITEETSTTVVRGSSLDLDEDGQDDLLVEEDVSCGANSPNRFAPQNGAEAGAIFEDYRTIVLEDAQSTSLSDQLFCHPAADFQTTMIVKSSNDSLYKLWTPENDTSGVRFVFELLGDPPGPIIFQDRFQQPEP